MAKFEKWERIPGSEDEVSTYGRIRKASSKEIRNTTNSGRDKITPMVGICVNGELKPQLVHRLVASVFIFVESLPGNHGGTPRKF